MATTLTASGDILVWRRRRRAAEVTHYLCHEGHITYLSIYLNICTYIYIYMYLLSVPIFLAPVLMTSAHVDTDECQ